VTQTDAKSQTLWFGYDNLNRQTQKRQTNSTGTLLASFSYSYDSADRVQTISYPALPSGTVLRASYTYDAAWRPASLYTSNWNVYLVNNATYTALDQPDQMTLYNGKIANWSYSNAMQRLNRLQVGTSASPSSVFDRSYSYDNVGNVKTIVDGTATPMPSQTFGYDERDRLTSWTSGSTSESYAYNELGNLSSKAGTSYSYGAQSASCAEPSLSKRHAATTVGGTSYCYDPNGNLTSGGRRSYSWTLDNLPSSVSQTSGSESYSYDADGERIKVVRGSVSTVELEGGRGFERGSGGMMGVAEYARSQAPRSASTASGLPPFRVRPPPEPAAARATATAPRVRH